ncbi:MAG TPA: phosphoglucosamine mutase [Lentisphaeria bacterium]|nr:MAG: phosphoglucosamine mutase [Lentisphaerae bacterium GWF2_38_69]HBM17005.1 phosphoglucosamine mutase [Lentisphaeria bacterium]
MEKKLFGTDGIRGKANTYPITPEIALMLGKSLGKYFKADREGVFRAVIGKDTRLSGYMLESALESGLVSMGMDVYSVGPLPTPAIARLIKSFNANCGIMITASHNPYEDNGLKIFGADGFKMPDSEELKIEDIMFSGDINSEHVGTNLLGKAHRIEDAKGRYVEFAKSTIKDSSLKGLKVILDCANGAAYSIAPWIFRELGAEVIKVGVDPDGFNINKNCGAMYPGNISNLIREHQADVGICFDGDADRVILLDSNGAVVNGDKILAMCAIYYKELGRLSNDTLVSTVMSNIGLRHAMVRHGIELITTQVGDRYVIEKMREGNFNLGGEQSGHIIFMDYVTTGDGIITALHVLKMMIEQQKPLAELANCMEEFPQKLVNIKVKEKIPIDKVPELAEEIKKCETELKENGRVLVRYSGTENLIRIMIEAKTYKIADSWTKKIAAIAENKLN